MAIYKITYTDEQWVTCLVDANSPEEAQEQFWAGEYYAQDIYGGEIQQDIDVEIVSELKGK